MLAEARRYRVFAGDLWRYLARDFPPEECRRILADELGNRETVFLELLDRAVYRRPASPYRALLAHAAIEHGDVAGLVREGGIEHALDRLHAAGVYLTLDEFKSRRPIVRAGGLEFHAADRDFDNPVLRRGYEGWSGGSSGAPRRTMVNFAQYVHQTATQRLLLEAFGIFGRPLVIWRPAPPGRTGFSNALRALRLQIPVEWYSQSPLGFRDVEIQDWLALRTAFVATRLRRPPLPLPRYVPLRRASVIASRVAELVARGTPPILDSTAGAGVRVALAAAADGLDLAETFFRLGGEPLTRARVEAIARVGGRARANYALSELGRAGIACAAPDRLAVDDVHVLSGRVGMLLRPPAERRFDGPALVLTTLHPIAPKLMLNVEIGDTGVLVERDCGCAIGEAGFRLHLHTIRSYEKLTSEGMNFFGADLVDLVENVLPARFGGGPTDYQFVEDELGGLPRVRLLVSPRVGDVDEAAVLEQSLAALADGPGYRQMMAGIWRDGGTLTVERAEPIATPSAKVPAFHVLPRA